MAAAAGGVAVAAAMDIPTGPKEHVLPDMLCCMCGMAIKPNPLSMCVHCIKTQVNITEGIATNITMHQCRGCLRYLRPPWVTCKQESRELMAICLRKISGLKKVKLIDAAWIWTEPHSKRLKIKLMVQKEVANGAVLQQAFVVEFVVRNQQCTDCAASYTNSTWKAIVQVRQRVNHKRTFFYLEQLLLKHNAHSHAIKIETFRDGMDFMFAERNQATRLVDFLEGTIPIKVKTSKKLISHDNHSNFYNYHYTYLVTVVPVCKDDLVVLPTRLAQNLGTISPLCLVQRISSGVQLVDPCTAQAGEVSAEKYWKFEFPALQSSARLVEFVVLGVEPLPAKDMPTAPANSRLRRTRLAEVVVAKESDLGQNDVQHTCVTHLGHLLRAGDTVLGYDLATANLPDQDLKTLKADLPDVVLVRKKYGKGADKQRQWKLREMDKEAMEVANARDAAMTERDYEVFQQQLEADQEMRRQVNMYKMFEKMRVTQGFGVGAVPQPSQPPIQPAVDAEDRESIEENDWDDEERVRLDELLDDLTLDDPDAEPDGAADQPQVFAAGAAPMPAADAGQLLLDEDDPDL